jgi:AcrR family transcriptional regulator
VRKTRGQLRQGLVRLMREKSIQDITVKELCEECDINRGTFYLHYTDVYQLLHSIEDELLEEFERVLDGLTAQSVLAAATPSPAMCSMFELLADNADMCLVLLCHNGDMAFLEKVKDIVRLRVLTNGARSSAATGGTPMIMYIPSSYPAASACCCAGWEKRCPSPRGRWQPWWRRAGEGCHGAAVTAPSCRKTPVPPGAETARLPLIVGERG